MLAGRRWRTVTAQPSEGGILSGVCCPKRQGRYPLLRRRHGWEVLLSMRYGKRVGTVDSFQARKAATHVR